MKRASSLVASFLSAVVGLSAAGGLMAGDIPPLVLPEGVGVNIHFQQGHEKDLDLIAQAGFKFVRMDLGWGGVERSKGVYDWSASDELLRNLAARGMRAILILDYSNSLYEETVPTKDPITGKEHKDVASPQKPESVAAFARWAAEAARHHRGKGVIWEIWNEPNIFFWKPKPDVTQYNALALATCKAVREADPQATIIGPATSEIPLPFLEKVFESGLLQHFDAVSVHPYRNYRKAPETAVEEYRKLRALMDRYSTKPADKRIPIISGEWGYATQLDGGLAEITQGAFAARQQLVNLMEGVPISIWYDWKNDGPDRREREHNFGTVNEDLSPKTAYTCIQILTRQMGGYRLKQRIASTNSQDYLLHFTKKGSVDKLAAWTTGDPHRITLKARLQRKGNVVLTMGTGQPVGVEWAGRVPALEASTGSTYGSQGLKVEKGSLSMDLHAVPCYVNLEGCTLLTK